MVTITETKKLNKNGKSLIEGTCLSSDTKPTTYVNGSILLEMDTSTLYFYDEANSTWRAWS